jgi:hypothetical protein
VVEKGERLTVMKDTEETAWKARVERPVKDNESKPVLVADSEGPAHC